MNRFIRFTPHTTLPFLTQKTVSAYSVLKSVFCVLMMGGILSTPALAQDESNVIMHTLTVEVEHESGKDIKVQVSQAGEVNVYQFSVAQSQDPQFVESQLTDLDPAVFEAVKGALLRINRSEVLANSDSVNEVDVEWVTETCNDTDVGCEVMTSGY